MFRFVFLFFVFTCFATNVFSQWKQDQFVIGTYGDPRLSRDNNLSKDIASFKLAKDAYFNVLSGPQFYMGGRDFQMMDRTLDLAARFGMKLLVIDHRSDIESETFSKNEADTILNYFKNIDKKRRSAMLGYYFGGEFHTDKSSNVLKWTSYFRGKDRDKLAYTYLLPRIAFKSNSEYELYLDRFLLSKEREKRPEVVSFNAYPFYKDGSTMKSYFYNLAIIKEKAGLRPFWYYVLSAAHGNYSKPTEYQLAFSVFAPLAYGAKGVIYFTYETIPSYYGWGYQDGLINAYGNVTENYYTAKKINRFLSEVIGPVIMNSTYKGTYHTSGSPFNERIPPKYLLSSNTPLISSVSSDDILFGIFENNIDKIKYIVLVNKSSKRLENVKLYLKTNEKDKVFITSNYSDYSGRDKFSSVDLDKDLKTSQNFIKLSLDPGGVRVLMIE